MTSSALLNNVGRMSLLEISVGVALIGLGGVNLDRFTVSPIFNPNFLLQLDPISYLLSELLSSLRRFFDLRVAILRDFSSFSNFSLNWVNDC